MVFHGAHRIVSEGMRRRRAWATHLKLYPFVLPHLALAIWRELHALIVAHRKDSMSAAVN